MNRAYIVAGYMSSGNRALAAMLVAAGCAGNGSTDQPQQPCDLEPGHPAYVIIKHQRVAYWAAALARLGYAARVLVIAREPHATAHSASKIGHAATYQEARHERLQYLADTVGACTAIGLPWELITYESLTDEGARRTVLRWCDLPEDAARLPLRLDGQFAPPAWQNQNGKHYG